MQNAMTDYQFRSIIRMVLDLLRGACTKEEAIAALERLLEEK